MDIISMLRCNVFVTIMLCTNFLIYMVGIFLSVFMAIFVLSYDTTVNEFGYP